MQKSNSTRAQQVAHAASEFQQQCTGHAPRSVTAVLTGETLVITLQQTLSPAELALAISPADAAQVQEFHRQLFVTSADVLRAEIKRITGVEVCESAAEVQSASGTSRGRAGSRWWSGGPDGFQHVLRITVLEISGGKVKLGFDVDAGIPVHREGVWQQIRAHGPPDSKAAPVPLPDLRG